jgi:hypothetical protein
MKQTISILLALVVLFSPLQKVWLVVSFQLNQEYIAKTLCENKAKPQLQCEGKCHLKKQLQKAEQEEQKLPTSQKEKAEITLFYAISHAFDFRFFEAKALTSYPDLKDCSKPQVATLDIFQPPKV